LEVGLIGKNKKKTKKIYPWYRKFEGSVIETTKQKYDILGNYDFCDDNNTITKELPVGTSTKNYKVFLDSYYA
jgi:hypothetical protein